MKVEHPATSQLNTEFVEKRPYFWWWVRDKKALSVESVVEGVLAYGNMNDVYNLFKIVLIIPSSITLQNITHIVSFYQN